MHCDHIIYSTSEPVSTPKDPLFSPPSLSSSYFGIFVVYAGLVQTVKAAVCSCLQQPCPRQRTALHWCSSPPACF